MASLHFVAMKMAKNCSSGLGGERFGPVKQMLRCDKYEGNKHINANHLFEESLTYFDKSSFNLLDNNKYK